MPFSLSVEAVLSNCAHWSESAISVLLWPLVCADYIRSGFGRSGRKRVDGPCRERRHNEVASFGPAPLRGLRTACSTRRRLMAAAAALQVSQQVPGHQAGLVCGLLSRLADVIGLELQPMSLASVFFSRNQVEQQLLVDGATLQVRTPT